MFLAPRPSAATDVEPEPEPPGELQDAPPAAAQDGAGAGVGGGHHHRLQLAVRHVGDDDLDLAVIIGAVRMSSEEIRQEAAGARQDHPMEEQGPPVRPHHAEVNVLAPLLLEDGGLLDAPQRRGAQLVAPRGLTPRHFVT